MEVRREIGMGSKIKWWVRKCLKEKKDVYPTTMGYNINYKRKRESPRERAYVCEHVDNVADIPSTKVFGCFDTQGRLLFYSVKKF